MKKVLTALTLVFLFPNIHSYAQDTEDVREEPLPAQTEEIDLQVVYEKAFDEQIVDVIFDTATVSIEEAKKMGWKDEAVTREDKTKGKVLISYPRVVFISQGKGLSWLPDARRSSYYTKELRFYDKDGRLMNSLVLKKYGEEKIYLSPDKKYILVSRRPTEWAPRYSGGTLYDCDGKKVWEIEGPTPIAVSDEGYAVAAHLDWQVPSEPGGAFYIYDSKGKLLVTINNPAKDKTSPLYGEFSKDGEYTLLTFVKEAAIPTIFLLITKEGEILWKKDLLEYRYSSAVGEIDILPGKGITGAIYKGGLRGFFLDWTGNLRWAVPLTGSGYGSCVFAQDSENVYISSSRGYLWCFKSTTGDIIWMHKEPWSPPLDIRRRVPNTPEFREIYELSENVVVNGTYKIYLFDNMTGKLKAEIEYPDKQIFLSLHNGKIFVIDVADNKIEGLRIGEE